MGYILQLRFAPIESPRHGHAVSLRRDAEDWAQTAKAEGGVSSGLGLLLIVFAKTHEAKH